jgi:hypothetical protein
MMTSEVCDGKKDAWDNRYNVASVCYWPEVPVGLTSQSDPERPFPLVVNPGRGSSLDPGDIQVQNWALI